MKGVEDRFHILVAVSNEVNGEAYDSLKIVTVHEPRPAHADPFLFSSGYGPGMPLLRDDGSDRFTSIYLVDICMGIGGNSHSLVPEFYKALVNKIPEKITYVLHRSGPKTWGERLRRGQVGLAEGEIGFRFGHGHPHEHEHRGRQHAPRGDPP